MICTHLPVERLCIKSAKAFLTFSKVFRAKFEYTQQNLSPKKIVRVLKNINLCSLY